MNTRVFICIGTVFALLSWAGAFSPLLAAPNSIVPGRSIGHIRLGEPAAQAINPLGPAKDSDASMGNAWGVWMSRAPDTSRRSELDVLTKRDESGRHEFVEQIRITSPWFTTAQGIRVGSSRSAILVAYPSAQLIRQGSKATKSQTLVLYDDIHAGITFEFAARGGEQSGRCRAIVVHPKKQSVMSEYSSWYRPDDNGALDGAW